MYFSSIAANARQRLCSELVLLPLGHHSTLPLPIRSVPSKSSPRRILISSELPLLSFERSTSPGSVAVTVVCLDFLRPNQTPLSQVCLTKFSRRPTPSLQAPRAPHRRDCPASPPRSV